MKKIPFFLLALSIVISGTITLSSAEKVCKFTYIGVPENLNNDTLVLPSDSHVVAMSEYIHVGTPMDSILEWEQNSIVFIIDNSGSMQNYMGNDQWGSRFTVTNDLIDTIYNINPKTEVGLVIFGTHLYFDPNDDNLFVNCPAWDTGSYIPLLQLDATYNGQTGYEILKQYLATDTVDPGSFEWVDLEYQPSDFMLSQRSTNIYAGFEAAKHGMLSSTFAEERHFNIFFSDGEATYPMGGPLMNAFIEGKDCPTTFTVYFTQLSTAPQSLTDMTANIQTNGYSSSNSLSDLWTIETDYDTLMSLLMENVIGQIMGALKTAKPVKLTVNNTDISTVWDDTGFAFDKLFELLGVYTDFNFIIDYEVYKDSVTSTGDTIQIKIMDTTHVIDFTVNLENGVSVPDSVALTWWGRRLEFFHGDTLLSLIDETMDTLEIRFTEYEVDTTYGYEDVSIIITHSNGSTQDEETFKLNDQGGYLSFKFPRSVGDPTPGDGILQHQSPDDIIAIFRNKDLVLDTLRISTPYMLSGVLMVHEGIYFDNNADGYIDSIAIGILGTKIKENVDELMDNIKLPDFRNFDVLSYNAFSGGIGVIVKEGMAVMPRTYVTDEDILVVTDTVILSQGGMLIPSTVHIIDSVAPVINSASLIDSLKITGRDELTITFSETVELITGDIPFKFFQVNGAVKYDAELSVISQNGDIGVFEVESLIGVASIQDGDSIRINWTLGDNVFDSLRNNQDNPENVRREIDVTLIKVILSVKKGIYFDNNADGFVDSVFVEISGEKIQENADGLIDAMTLPDFRNFEIKNYNAADNGIGIYVDEKASIPTTYVTDEDYIFIAYSILPQGGVVMADTVPVIDSVAPVIHWKPGSAILIDYKDPLQADTLAVLFSEPIEKINHQEPFYFLDISDNNKVFTAELKVIKQYVDIVHFEVTGINNNVTSMQDGDSIWIHEGDRVSDNVTNYQNNKKNIRRKLTVETKLTPFDLTPVSITPLDLGDINNIQGIPDVIIDILMDQNIFDDLQLEQNENGDWIGMILQVIPDDIELLLEDFELEGYISILDAVGNHVIKEKKMAFDKKTKSLLYVWNGRNSNGRYVGKGAYLAVFKIIPYPEGKDGEKSPVQFKKILIGVKD